jgi:hypothetical protein
MSPRIVRSILSNVLHGNEGGARDSRAGGSGSLIGAVLGSVLHGGSSGVDGRPMPVYDGESAYREVYMSDLANGTERGHHQASFTHEGVLLFHCGRMRRRAENVQRLRRRQASLRYTRMNHIYAQRARRCRTHA